MDNEDACGPLLSVQFGPLLFLGQISVNAVAGWFWHRPTAQLSGGLGWWW